MNKQFEIISELNEVNEVAIKKKSPALKILKYALVGLTAFVALVLLFAVGADKINPAVEGFVQKIGLGEQITVAETSPVAHAWTNPSSNTDTGSNRVATTSSFTWKVQNATNTLRPETAHSGWNWGYWKESGNMPTLSANGEVSCNGNIKFVIQTIFYVDIYVDDLAQQAIANGQIKSCSVQVEALQVGTANVIDQGTIYGTFFLCASKTGTSSASCNSMGNNDWVASADKFDDDNQYGRHNYSSPQMTLTLDSSMRKIRFGLYYRTVKDSGLGGAEVFAPVPSISLNFGTDKYVNGKVKFAVAGDHDNVCHIVPATGGTYNGAQLLDSWSGTAAFDSTNLCGGTVIGNVIAEPAPGYYFTGWKVTSGGLTGSWSATSTTLSIGGGPYLKGGTDTVIQATFRKLTINEAGLNYTYLQELDGSGNLVLTDEYPTDVPQGPYATSPGTKDGHTFVLTGGIYSADNPTFSARGTMYQSTDTNTSYSANAKPTEAGSYRYLIGVFVEGTQSDSTKVMGYYISEPFTISPVTVTNSSSHVVTTSGDNIPTRTYSGNAYTPVPDYVDVFVEGRPYRLINDEDYTIASYKNNVNISRNSSGEVSKGAYFTFTARKNFQGQNDVYFGITHLDVSSFTYEESMAIEIQKNYGVVYTGFEQRPDVISLRITGRVFKEGRFASYDINNSTEVNERTELKTFTIYLQTQGDANAYNNALSGKEYYEYDASGTKGAQYVEISRTGDNVNAHNYFYLVGRDAGTIDIRSIYENNIDVCTYGGTNTSCASFEVELVERTGNMSGNITAYFDIAQLNLDTLPSSSISVEAQAETHVYTSNAITPIPDLVYVTVTGIRSYIFVNGGYEYQPLPITYSFARTGASVTPDFAEKTGTALESFTSINSYFSGTRDTDFKYSNNVNAQSEAVITINLAGDNVIGTVATNFTITPRDLSELATGFGAEEEQTVGKIVNTGENNTVTYLGVDENGNHIPVTTNSPVWAYPDGTQNAKTLVENKDFTFSFENHDQGVTQGARIIANGMGNYKGSVSGVYRIKAMTITADYFDPLPSEVYTGAVINPMPQNIIININGQKVSLKLNADYTILGEGRGENKEYSPYDETTGTYENNHYITISLNGTTDGSGTCNYYGVSIKVYFAITKKLLTSSDIESYASWQDHQDEVTYTGESLQDLTLITHETVKTNNTLYLWDTVANPDNPLVMGTDYEVISWGENINAGDTAGSVTVAGVGNYAGQITIYFKIYPRSIEKNNANIIITLEKLNYDYTGSPIEAGVSSVKDEGLGKQLQHNDDYTIEYGGSSTDGLIYNVDVLKGGLVTIVGKNNYIGEKTVSFTINKIGQTIRLENPVGNGYNSNLKAETKANDSAKKADVNNGSTGVIYADYEVNAGNGGSFKVVAYTDAIYPLRLVKIKAINIEGSTSGVVNVSYESLEEYEDVNGKKWAKTTAVLSFTGSYGIIRVYAVQEDESITNNSLNNDKTNPDAFITSWGSDDIYQNRGNYISYEHTWGKDDVYSIYAKKQDSTGVGFQTSISKVYGNNSFELKPGLDSIATLGSLHNYIATTNNDQVISLDGDSGASRTCVVGVVGTAVINISHEGYVPSEFKQSGDDANAYVAFSVDVTITVKPRTLIISFEELTIPYGIDPTKATDENGFKYTYTTVSGSIPSEQDAFTSLVYENGKADKIEDILTGYSVDYNSALHGPVNDDPGYSLEILYVNVTPNRLYPNYNVIYQASTLKVEKKTLTAVISMIGSAEANMLTKVYGDPNPTEEQYTIAYSGFAYDENENTLNFDSAFKAPSVVYAGGVEVDGIISDEITEYTLAGGYNVALDGGVASNYCFEVVKVEFSITPAPVTIKLGQIVDGVFVEAENGIVVEKGYDGVAVALTRDNVLITGRGDLFVEPDLSDIKIVFRYGLENVTNPQALAGTYNVKVEFTATSNDNYTDTSVVFEGAIVINKVPPKIELNKTMSEYTGRPIEITKVTPIISQISGGKAPGNTMYNKLLFEKNPSEGYTPEVDENGIIISYDETKYTETPPSEIGKYDMIVVYVANANDSYCSVNKYFEEVLEITTGIAEIAYKGENITVVYDGKEHGVSSSDFEISHTPQQTGIKEIITTGTIEITYYHPQTDEWTAVAPKDAGTYSVRVEFTPVEGAQVNGNSRTFAGIITITPFDLVTSGHIIAQLNGISYGWHVATYNALGHPLDNSEIVVKGVLEDENQVGRGPKGTITITYINNKTGIETSTPVNVGIYTAKVVYNAHENGDNYFASKFVNVGEVVQIEEAEVLIEDMLTIYTYAFTGKGVAMPKVNMYGVEVSAGVYDAPKGSLSYQYRMSGTSDAWSEDLPVNAGKYDVLVTYVQNTTSGPDNYYSQNGKEGIGVIQINPILPNIVINTMVFDFGETIVPSYVLRGAQADVDGPMEEIANDIAVITIEYGTRYVNSITNKIEYEWSTKAPVASGKYSVKITYEVKQEGYSNYSTNTVTKQDCLTINNIIPHFVLEEKTATYDGNRVSVDQAKIYASQEDANNGINEYVKWYEGIDMAENCYYGTIGYEYKKVGTESWSTLAPREVGLYDVRIRYYENAKSDVFTSTTILVEECLEIKQLVIKVMPLYGQGHVYDGSYVDGDAIAYVYSYEKDGYKYMVYANVGDLLNNEVVDISKAEYVDENGYVYTIVTDTALVTDAWRDYYTKQLVLGTGSFVDGDEVITFNFADLDDVSGKVSYTAMDKNYVIDLDSEIVYLNDGIDYTLRARSGYFFSEVDGLGAVNVIEIDPAKVIDGVFNLNVAGKTKRYSVNFNTLKVVAEDGTIYPMYESVGLIEYVQDGIVYTIMIDHNSYYQVDSFGKAIYKHANGTAYLIDINTSEVEKIAVMKVETASFSYYTYEGVEKNVTLSVDDLSAIYANNAYIGKYQDESHSFIIDLKARTIRVQTYYNLTRNGGLYAFLDKNAMEDSFTLTQLIATEKKDMYLYYSPYGDTYYVDIANMIVRNIENQYKFSAKDSKIFKEIDGVERSFAVDVEELTYDLYKNGKLYDKTSMYGSKYDVEKTTLIAGNNWSGSMRLSAQNAGAYTVGIGSLAIGGNYQISFVDGIAYVVERAQLQISFTTDGEYVYNGQTKTIEYVISGLVNDESISALSIKQEYEGDTINVTDNGYRTRVTVTSPNYYLENGADNGENASSAFSGYYFIEPAQMAPIVFERGDDVIYDGLKHYLALTNVERGAKVTYAGGTAVPYFIEPGVYTVTALVSKENYISQEVELALVIVKAKYNVTALEVPGTLKYGDALPELRCDSQEGTIALDPGQILLPTVTTYTWTFTPYSQDFYRFYEGNSDGGSTITGTIELKVQKAKANIEISGDLVQSETSPSAIVGIANGLSHNESDLVTIEYVSSDGTRYAKMPTSAGKYTVLVTYAGDEYHEETVYSTILTIEEESNYDWLIVLGSVLIGLSVVSTAFFLIRGKRKKLD